MFELSSISGLAYRYDTCRFRRTRSPFDGHCRSGWMLSSKPSSVGVSSLNLLRRATAPRDTSSPVQDSTSRRRVVFATSIKFNATPTCAPVDVFEVTMRAMIPTATEPTTRSRTRLSQRCRHKRRNQDPCDRSRSELCCSANSDSQPKARIVRSPSH